MKLPCGCRMWRKGQVFYIIPCSEECETYKYALGESRKRGNLIVKRRGEATIQ
jgi:hypothetical protein